MGKLTTPNGDYVEGHFSDGALRHLRKHVCTLLICVRLRADVSCCRCEFLPAAYYLVHTDSRGS